MMSGDKITVDQSNSKVGNDQFVGDKNETNITNNYNVKPSSGLNIDALLNKLQEEISGNTSISIKLDELSRYSSEKRSKDAIKGLAAKLEFSDRAYIYEVAIEQKEMFVQMLDKWSLYYSSQQIIAILLAKIETTFNELILSRPNLSDVYETNLATKTLIVDPIVEECCDTVLGINHNIAYGMIYWLAEQCFVRWHK